MNICDLLKSTANVNVIPSEPRLNTVLYCKYCTVCSNCFNTWIQFLKLYSTLHYYLEVLYWDLSDMAPVFTKLFKDDFNK